VQFAQFGQIDELRALLDETPELIDQADGRGMTALRRWPWLSLTTRGTS